MILLFTLTPNQPHPYSLTVLSIFELVTGFQHYLFRSYLDSGPPALHTINNYILKSFSYCIQGLSTYIWLFSTGFYMLGKENSYALVEEYPRMMCAVLTPKLLAVWFMMCIFFMALVNFTQVYWKTGYLKMNHELVFKGVLALGLAMEVCAYSIDYIFLQSFCIPNMAEKFLEMMIGRNENQDEVKFTNIPTGTLTINPIFAAFITLMYLTSVLIKKCDVIKKNKTKVFKKQQIQPVDNLAYGPDQSHLVAADLKNAPNCALLVSAVETRVSDQNPENKANKSEVSDQVHVATNEKTKSLCEVVTKSNETKTYKVILATAEETKASVVRTIKVKPVDNTGEGAKVACSDNLINPDFSNTSNIEDKGNPEIPNILPGVPNKVSPLCLSEVPIPNQVPDPNPAGVPCTQDQVPIPSLAAISTQNLQDGAPKSISAIREYTPEGIGIALGTLFLAAVIGLAALELDQSLKVIISNEVLYRCFKAIHFLLPSYWTIANQSCHNYSYRKIKNLIKSE